MVRWLKGYQKVWVALAVCTTAGCGSGDSSPDATVDVVQAPTQGPTPAPSPSSTPTADDVEAGRSNSAIAARASDAYKMGITGRGVRIAVIDTGINAASAEFQGRIDSGSRDLRGNRGIVDKNSHGTSVSAIIGAARNGQGLHGIAYEATILSLNASIPGCSPASCDVSERATILGLDAAVASGARIVNMSLGSDTVSSEFLEAIRRAADAGILIVVSAGNAGRTTPRGGAQAIVEAAPDHVLIAGGHDLAGRAYGTGNRAGGGVAASRYLTALGEGVSTINNRDVLIVVEGTSFAAAAISGAAALLLQARPQLTGAQVARLLLDNASDLGTPGHDAVFGNGMLNVAAAFAALSSQR